MVLEIPVRGAAARGVRDGIQGGGEMTPREKAAHDLAMLVLQSELYLKNADVRDTADAVLAYEREYPEPTRGESGKITGHEFWKGASRYDRCRMMVSVTHGSAPCGQPAAAHAARGETGK